MQNAVHCEVFQFAGDVWLPDSAWESRQDATERALELANLGQTSMIVSGNTAIVVGPVLEVTPRQPTDADSQRVQNHGQAEAARSGVQQREGAGGPGVAAGYGDSHRPKRTCYIAGPYTHGDTPSNVADAMAVWHQVADSGFIPFLPHLCMHLHMQEWRPYEFWMEWCLAWVGRCGALLRIPGESQGADREVAYAASLGIPVFYSVSELRGQGE